MNPNLTDLIKKGKKLIYIVSDLPSSQCRNKKFWLALHFALEHEIELRWIYLESGHGKGILHGITAVVKKSIKDVISYNPDIPMYNVLDLLTYSLQDRMPSITLHDYQETEVLELQNQKPCLERVTVTMKIHEVQYKNTNGELPLTAKNVSSGKGRRMALATNLLKQPQCTDSSSDGSDNQNVSWGILLKFFFNDLFKTLDF